MNELYDKIREYNQYYNRATIAQKLNVTYDYVRYACKSMGLKPHGHILRNYNPKFFGYETNKVCYWAGFMMADGCLSAHSLTLNLSLKDEERLLAFADDIQLDRKHILYDRTKKGTTYGMGSITMTSVVLIKQLERFGIVPRKSYNWSEPTHNFTDTQLKYFLVGWIDGDGYFKTSPGKEVFRVTGNLDGLKWFKQSLIRLGYTGHIAFEKMNTTKAGKLVISGRTQIYDLVFKTLGIPQLDPIYMRRRWQQAFDLFNITFKPKESNVIDFKDPIVVDRLIENVYRITRKIA